MKRFFAGAALLLLLSLGGYVATFTASAADGSQAMCPTFPTLPNDSPTFPTFPGPPSIPVVTTPNVTPCTTTTTTTTTPSTTMTTGSTSTSTPPVTVTTVKTVSTPGPTVTAPAKTVTTVSTQVATTSVTTPGTTTPGATATTSLTTSVTTPGSTTTVTTKTSPLTPPTKTTTTPASKPATSIVKDPKLQTVASGGTATFTITVKNTGNVTLTAVTVSDQLSASCDRSVGTLASGASKSYTCTAADVLASFENTATVTGNPPKGAPVTATDHANVKVKVAPFVPPKPKPAVKPPKKKVAPFVPPKPKPTPKPAPAPVQKPNIAIVKDPKLQSLTTKIVTTKTANGSANRAITYGTAQFTIKVTNTGNTVLDDVAVSDAMSPDCDRSIGSLALGASTTYTCTSTSVKRNFTNVAIATGESPNGTKVTASDNARVVVTIVPTTSVQPAKFTG